MCLRNYNCTIGSIVNGRSTTNDNNMRARQAPCKFHCRAMEVQLRERTKNATAGERRKFPLFALSWCRWCVGVFCLAAGAQITCDSIIRWVFMCASKADCIIFMPLWKCLQRAPVLWPSTATHFGAVAHQHVHSPNNANLTKKFAVKSSGSHFLFP